ncbi:MAG: pyruvoyl-dependent arginine decarboxylase [Desulfurella sp.]|jgi:arginine decarboxylase|uniref:Pyruvoyl-dependent arginine decarboxylase AaxB n=1 Tax=Desulfurella multipotens TaxID=79269 RepID=A0A1G6JS41_9BACT|nr:arginine decarboxylase, pyruvoyl-dependent [Desulfurella multipotens]AHF97173.1 pyruvoyl-dependent arginine decarboxylase [Desulfurella acetivorans A63]PMP68462.1 MAG: arginine decarboxylase, pyruvoyl-dependent [Desulfurella multipotens]SDC21471.1 arginine decarboxylase [Desulfurella multipotens]
MIDIFSSVPNIYKLSSSNAEGLTLLNAFDVALLESGVGNTNLVKMSSILPPNCEYQEEIKLPLGALVPVAYASIVSDKKGQKIAAAVAAAIPKDKTKNGLIMEYENYDISKNEAERIVIEMAKWGMDRRGYEIEKIVSISAEHTVEKCGCAFACVVLWWK